jgi:hypothetical protein
MYDLEWSDVCNTLFISISFYCNRWSNGRSNTSKRNFINNRNETMANDNWSFNFKILFLKIFICYYLGACGTSIFLVLVGYIECNSVLAVIFISLSVAFIGFQASGSLISHLDIASNYAGEFEN